MENTKWHAFCCIIINSEKYFRHLQSSLINNLFKPTLLVALPSWLFCIPTQRNQRNLREDTLQGRDFSLTKTDRSVFTRRDAFLLRKQFPLAKLDYTYIITHTTGIVYRRTKILHKKNHKSKNDSKWLLWGAFHCKYNFVLHLSPFLRQYCNVAPTKYNVCCTPHKSNTLKTHLRC